MASVVPAVPKNQMSIEPTHRGLLGSRAVRLGFRSRARRTSVERLRALARRADTAAGTKVERLIVSHHRRRLRRLEQETVLDAPGGGWASSGLPPRGGNAVDVLVDGSEALPAIVAAVESARSFVWLAGWYF